MSQPTVLELAEARGFSIDSDQRQMRNGRQWTALASTIKEVS